MQQLLKILFFVFAIFHSNVSEAKIIVFEVVVSEIILTVNEVKVNNEPTKVSENDFRITCKSESVLLVYRNLAKFCRANAAKGGTTVLGHYPAYTKLATELGARRFQIPTNV